MASLYQPEAITLALLPFLLPEPEKLPHLDLSWIAWERGARSPSSIELDGHRLDAWYPEQDRSCLPGAFACNEHCQVLQFCVRELVRPDSYPLDLESETSLLLSVACAALHYGDLDTACQCVACSPLPDRLRSDDLRHEGMERLSGVVSKPVIKRQICLHFAIFPKTGFYTSAWAASGLAICFGVGSTIIRRPYFGRSVISGCGTTEKPGTSRGV